MAKGYLYDNGDELITREDVNEVPDSSTAHAGDILELDSNKKPKWTTPESELPSTGSASAGDVLTLDSDKEPVWSAPSGGGGIPVLNYIVNPDGTEVSFARPGERTALSFAELKALGTFALIFSVGGASVSSIDVYEYEEDDVTHREVRGYFISNSTSFEIRQILDDDCTEDQTVFSLVSNL